ncbi:hypothetical protein FHR24_002508 [Wenyingzhuangia heitensis]|uniref:Histidyl-tRNA synthetase n=1 Tax=Wenyingzhuangia heitensis TaxID=1487859 RepID=A0ABX0UDU6_9FLAO|nr:DUF6495 family protein [Wenyingzhuangia heitensis]NIJ46030.1 hypothetical protein [Wenyingzhuangia heitensis]
MKYIQLTKEQLEELHEEFATFLASQQIDVKEWNEIKKNKPEVADEELNLFSDLVWEDVLSKAKYIEHFSKSSLNLFCCTDGVIQRIMIKSNDELIDLSSQEGIQYLLNDPKSKKFEFFKGAKKYDKERNLEIFDLVLKGASINKEGALYQNFEKFVN